MADIYYATCKYIIYKIHSSRLFLYLFHQKGGIYKDGAVITDPVVMSEDKKHGPTDLGRMGIINFFSNHVCNKYCKAHWTKPRNPKQQYHYQQGTSMIEVPTQTSRTPLSYYN